MVHVKNHVSKTLRSLCMVCISVVILVMWWNIPVNAAESSYEELGVYQLEFPSDGEWPDYDFHMIVESDVPVYFFVGIDEKIACMITEPGSAFIRHWWGQNGEDYGSCSGTCTETYLPQYPGSFGDEYVYSHLTQWSPNVFLFESYDSLVAYVENGDESGLIIKPADIEPDWSTADYDPFLYLDGFSASFDEDAVNVLGSWNGIYLDGKPYGMGEGYVRLEFGFALSGQPPQISSKAVKYPDYFQLAEGGFTVPVSDLTIPEGYYLAYVKAVPYYPVWINETTEWLYQCCSTTVYFDETGLVDDVVQVAPGVPSYDDENPEYTIYSSITNFFSNFWDNFMDMLYELFIPDKDEILAYFEELNAWFSDRFGFIWYPFDLALQLVAALAGGEADSRFVIPAGELVILGETYTIWNSQEIDLDPVGLFVYVRYFTSVLLVCGVVRLAINKWDSWIGGRAK